MKTTLHTLGAVLFLLLTTIGAHAQAGFSPMKANASVALALASTQPDGHYTARQDATGPSKQVGAPNQELVKISPELMPTGAAGNQPVNDALLTPVLLEAIKEQQRQINFLNKYAQVSSQRAAEAEEASVRRMSRAEAAIAALEQRLRLLEAGGARATAQR
jgi:hypothetical protein